jgi:hypothetical protein
MRVFENEGGQTVVEFGIICTVLFLLCLGIVDVGRAFFAYNAVAAAARYGARWGSVVGGTCAGPPPLTSSSDWCNQFGSQGTGFWTTAGNGNLPNQPAGTSCPTVYDKSFAYYYSASSFNSTNTSSIVGAVAQRFDTNNGSFNSITGALTPGFNLSQVKVCIDLPTTATGSTWLPGPGQTVRVTVYYQFNPVGPALLINHSFDLVASSQYDMES